MKAEITDKGCLRIVAETGIESFALDVWFREYTKDGGPSVTLRIETTCLDGSTMPDVRQPSKTGVAIG
jgi:hypothetical protein